MNNNIWDYIVIGAGHNGMTAACTLAKAGKSVLVVEQRPITGGLSASHAYLKEAPQHLLSIGAIDDVLMSSSPMVNDFKLREYGYQTVPLHAPYGWMNEDGDTLLLHSSFERAVEEIRYFSPKDAQTYLDLRETIDFAMGSLEKLMCCHPARLPKMELGKMLLKLATDKAIRKNLSRMISVSAYEIVSETFESDAMQGLFAFWCSMFAPATVQGSGVFLTSLGSLHRSGVARPVGGMSGMIAAFEKFFTAHGGEIRVNQKVDQLVMEGNRVVGVRIAGGEELRARHAVLANCAPQVALGQLLPDSAKDRDLKSKLEFLPANSNAVAAIKIDIAFGGRVSYPKADAKRKKRDDMDVRKTCLATGTLAEYVAHNKACLRGEQVDFLPPLALCVLSSNDASIAPPGQDVLYVYANVPVNPVGGWDACKRPYCDNIMATARHYLDGLDTELGRVETTPKDFEDRFGAPNGIFYHVDMLPTRMGMNRPAPGLGGYKTPIDGLYLASAGSHPSGGVCGWPGRLAAECALESQ